MSGRIVDQAGNELRNVDTTKGVLIDYFAPIPGTPGLEPEDFETIKMYIPDPPEKALWAAKAEYADSDSQLLEYLEGLLPGAEPYRTFIKQRQEARTKIAELEEELERSKDG